MEPDLNRARGIDEGPFSQLVLGRAHRIENPDNVTLLGALAAWTDRVRLGHRVIQQRH
jgi:alkanesulfonate monooxygenase SsuD/methylene tetrahydromethanopterin reductase-like flavin-dependent oxidoreductase (luciferase family)